MSLTSHIYAMLLQEILTSLYSTVFILFRLDFNYKPESVITEMIHNGLTMLNHLHCLIHPHVT